MTSSEATGRRRSRSRASRNFTIGAVVGAIALVAAVVWSSMAGAGEPDQQHRVALPGLGEGFVNLWTEQAGGGGRQLTAQVTDIGGWPEYRVSSVDFHVRGPGQAEPIQAPGAYSADGPGRGQVFNAIVDMDAPGQWLVTVRYTTPDGTGETTFGVELDG